MRPTLSIRLSQVERQRLRDVAERLGEAPSALAARLVEEGLRMAGHPGIVFRPTSKGGTTPGLVAGPDVAEVMAVLRGLDSTGEEAVTETAEWFGLHPDEVRSAVRYTASFQDEIEAEMNWRATVAADVKAQYDKQQTLLR